MKTVLLFSLYLISSSLAFAQLTDAPTPSEITNALNGGPVDINLHLQFSSGVPDTQKRIILDDFRRFQQIDVKPNPEATSLFQVEINTPNMEKWFTDRAHYIVEEGFDYMAHLRLSNSPVTYPMTPLPQSDRPTKTSGVDRGGNGQVVGTIMSNLGVAIYLDGKKAGDQRGLNIPGVGLVDVLSPRSGIFRIGALLFRNLSQFRSMENMAHSIYRLRTYFHEARHSDGNGTSTGFFHAVCPPDHDYAGFASCDKRTNGAYAVSAAFVDTAVQACTTCTASEKEALRVMMVDSKNRILSNYSAPLAVDEAPTGTTVSTLSESCLALQQQGLDITAYDFCRSTTSPQPATLTNNNYRAGPGDASPEYATTPGEQ